MIKAAREGCYSLNIFWSRKGIIMGIKPLCFKRLVYEAMLSGLECELIARAQMKRMESEMMMLMREREMGRLSLSHMSP